MSIQKGKEFEKETAALAGKYGKRVARSGAVGTTEGIKELAGDCRWKLPWLDKDMMGESKHGYSEPNERAKSMRIQRDWFDKHSEQARALNFYPFWAFKFKWTKDRYIVIPFDVMEHILNVVNDLYEEGKSLKKVRESANEVAQQNKELKDEIYGLKAEIKRLRGKV